MWIAYTPLNSPLVTISGGTFAGDSDGTELFNGYPRDPTRVQWPSGTMTTSTTIVIRATFASMPLPAVGAFLGLSLPPGCKVIAKARKDGDATYTTAMGGNSATGRTIRRSDGTIGLVWHFAKVANWPYSDPAFDINITGIEITIYNDVSGSATIAASSYSDLGEAFISPADYIPLQRNIDSKPAMPERNRAVDGTILPVKKYLAPSRDETYSVSNPGTFSGIANAPTSLRTILANASAAFRGMFIPRWHADRITINPAGGNASETIINDSALYGVISSRDGIKMADEVGLEASIQVSEVT